MTKEKKTNNGKPPNVERRFIPIEAAELRVATADDGPGKTEGYVALYDRWSPVYGDFRERIAPGFFDDAIASGDVRLLRDHNSSMVLGRNRAGTLTLTSDDTGLHHEAPLPDTTYARDLVVSMGRGDVTGASFAFSLPPDGTGDTWAKGEDGVMERTLLRAAEVYDVSVVTFPFYPDTTVAVRSLDTWREQRAEHDQEDAKPEPEGGVGEEAPPDAPTDDQDLDDLRRRLQLGL